MAFEGVLNKIPGLIANASGTLADKQYYGVIMKGASYPLEVAIGTEGANAIGILQNKPTAGQPAVIAGVGSVTKMVVGTGGLDAGDLVALDSAGKGVTADADDAVIGIALDTTTTDGQLGTVHLTGAAGTITAGS